MNTNENVLLDEINQTITALEKMKENVLSKLPFSYRLKKRSMGN